MSQASLQIANAVKPPANYPAGGVGPTGGGVAGAGGSKPYIFGGGRDCAPKSCPGPGFDNNYDCSGLAMSVAASVPGGPPVGGSTHTLCGAGGVNGNGGCTPVAFAQIDNFPITWCFTGWGDDGGVEPGHMWVTVCGKTGDAHCTGCNPDIDNGRQNFGKISRPLACFVPPGLEKLTMVSCSAACNGTGSGACPGTGGPPPPPGSCGGGQNGFSCPNSFESCKSGGQCSAGSSCSTCVGGYFNAVGWAESGNDYKAGACPGPTCGSCLGKYQFCPGTVQNYWGACPGNTAWLNDPTCQDNAAVKYALGNWNEFKALPNWKALLCKPLVSANGTHFLATQAAILGGSQFGFGNVMIVLNGGQSYDGNGVATSDYMAKFAETSIDEPWGDNTCGNSVTTGGGGCTPTPPCGDPALTGSWVNDPCTLPPPPSPPGQKFSDYLKDWWSTHFTPAIKNMVTQLYAYRVWETDTIGHIMDAQDVNKGQRVTKRNSASRPSRALTPMNRPASPPLSQRPPPRRPLPPPR